jgi:hypothetical protein
MASQLEHMTFATFLGYHGTTVSDPLLCRYAEMYDSFTLFRYSIPQASIDKAFIKWMQQTATLPTAAYLNEIPVYPCPISTQINEPIVVSTTPTSITTVLESSNNQAVHSLIAEYLDDDTQHQFYKFEEQHTEPPPPPPPVNSPDSPTLSLSSLSTIAPSPPELQSLPVLQPLSSAPPSYISTMAANQSLIPKKDMIAMKEEHNINQKNKRKRIANIPPQQQKPKKIKSGRPSTAETLTRIANDQNENDQISSQDLILRAIDGSEKKKKTILTCSTKSIELYYLKQYACYDFIGELRKNALDTIKEQKNILEKLLHIEKMVTQGIEPCKI